MSKNYYITTKDAGFLFDHMKGAEIDYDNKRFHLHIAQTAGGMTPLLQTHTEFSTWSGLTDYLKENEQHVKIFDEYEVLFSIVDFLNIIKTNNKNNISRMSIYPDMRNRDEYYMDKDGYEWCRTEFC